MLNKKAREESRLPYKTPTERRDRYLLGQEKLRHETTIG
jgi:hypothetical protein